MRVKTAVLGGTLRVVTDDGDEFTDDIALIGDCRTASNQAKAARIVRTWNAHEGLIEAISFLLELNIEDAIAREVASEPCDERHFREMYLLEQLASAREELAKAGAA